MLYLIFAMTFAVLITLFAIQNAMLVTINFLSWSGNTSFAMVVLGSAAAGVLIALLSQAMSQLRLRLSLRQSEKRIHELESELVKTQMLNRNAKSEQIIENNRVI